ncbi:DNA-binding protein [Clostridium botulinum]|nr:DNA-binding protein [Clostridium botulinum]
MVKLKQWMSWIIGAVCFMIVSVINIIDKKYLQGIIWIILAIVYIIISINSHKGSNKSHENILSNKELKNLNNEIEKLTADGKFTKAVKEYRMATGADLIEAKKYVDSLSKKETK